jgi:hypothetical protein
VPLEEAGPKTIRKTSRNRTFHFIPTNLHTVHAHCFAVISLASITLLPTSTMLSPIPSTEASNGGVMGYRTGGQDHAGHTQ